ncbi:Uncharacterized protein Adt_35145 [Abeliophyllum distichum]|uniref:Uncharacterized protein n=1 Tax=Abeliophyllum distichum TaxID=126358 RepID=A0ABD1QDW1_9LAMI
MPRMKMSPKRSRMDMPPSSSFEEEDPQAKRIEGCPVFLGKNVDLASFTFDGPSFHIEDLFSAMGWVSILTLHDKVYPSIVKDFYKKMVFSLGTGISCLVKNKRIKITQELIRSILHLEDGIRLYTTKTILHLEEYNPVEACRHVTEKHFDNPTRLSTNQLTLTCRVLHNIIAHIIVPRKVSFCDSVVLLPKASDTINTSTLKRMKIFKEDGQWVAKSKGFDNELGPSTLPFEGGEEMDDDEDEPLPRPRSQRSSSSASGFNEDHFNLLNGRIDSFTSSIEGTQYSRRPTSYHGDSPTLG